MIYELWDVNCANRIEYRTALAEVLETVRYGIAAFGEDDVDGLVLMVVEDETGRVIDSFDGDDLYALAMGEEE